MVDWRLSTGVLGRGREEKRRQRKEEREGEGQEGDLLKECGRDGVKGRALAPETNAREGGP